MPRNQKHDDMENKPNFKPGDRYRKVYADRVTAGIVPPMDFLKPRKGVERGERKTFGFTGSQRTRIQRAAGYLEATFGKENLTFCTLTYGYEVEHAEAKKHWSTLLKRLKRRAPISYVWVAEIQPKRFLRSGEAVIHFHAIFSRRVNAKQLWTDWEEITGARNRVDIQPVKRNAGAYISKYMCKAGKEASYVERDLDIEQPKFCPTKRKIIAQNRAAAAQFKLGLSEIERMYGKTGWAAMKQAMTIQGNRAGVSQDVSKALKPVLVDSTPAWNAIPPDKGDKVKFAQHNAEQFSFLAVWGFDA